LLKGAAPSTTVHCRPEIRLNPFESVSEHSPMIHTQTVVRRARSEIDSKMIPFFMFMRALHFRTLTDDPHATALRRARPESDS
jgi:hypothetical protein